MRELCKNGWTGKGTVTAAAEGHNASADVTIYLVCLGILCRIISFVYLLLLSIRDMLVVQVALCHLFEINFTKYIRHQVQFAPNSNTNWPVVARWLAEWRSHLVVVVHWLRTGEVRTDSCDPWAIRWQLMLTDWCLLHSLAWNQPNHHRNGPTRAALRTRPRNVASRQRILARRTSTTFQLSVWQLCSDEV